MDDVVVIDAASININEFLLVAPEPSRKGTKTTERTSFIISSTLYQDQLQAKNDKKAAELNAKEARKIQRAENKVKKMELYEELQKQKLERANLRAIAANNKKEKMAAQKNKRAVSKKNKSSPIDVISDGSHSINETNENMEEQSRMVIEPDNQIGDPVVNRDKKKQQVNAPVDPNVNTMGDQSAIKKSIDISGCKGQIKKKPVKAAVRRQKIKKVDADQNNMSKNDTESAARRHELCLTCCQQVIDRAVAVSCLLCKQLCHLKCALVQYKNVSSTEYTCKKCVSLVIF